MEYDLIQYIQGLLGSGIKGYVLSKPENTPYPAFTVEDGTQRGLDVHGDGKPFDYQHDVQVNLIGTKFSTLTQLKNTLVEALDGFSGVLGSHEVIDCRLQVANPLKTFNKTFQYVLLFNIRTL